MSLKSKILKLYYWGNLDKKKIEDNQKAIRNIEWDAIESFIKPKSKFLDVGCGAGYAMQMAEMKKNCLVYGADPVPGAHGVGRYSELNTTLNIIQAFAEKLPYNDNDFDIVYSSHVLEHVSDEEGSLNEMKRVLKKDGILIIGVPTSNMAWLNFISQMLFTSHHRLVNFLLSPFKFINTAKIKFVNVIFPVSHSHPRAKTVCYDIKRYKIRNWGKTIEKYFEIVELIKPAFYPYPEYRQLFKIRTNSRYSSSVFFICKPKK